MYIFTPITKCSTVRTTSLSTRTPPQLYSVKYSYPCNTVCSCEGHITFHQDPPQLYSVAIYIFTHVTQCPIVRTTPLSTRTPPQLFSIKYIYPCNTVSHCEGHITVHQDPLQLYSVKYIYPCNQGWANVLFKRTQCSCILLRSFQKNTLFSHSFVFFIKRMLRSLRSFTFFIKECCVLLFFYVLYCIKEYGVLCVLLRSL